MTIKEFEKKLRDEVHDGIRIVPHPTNEDMAGVYLNDLFVCGVPSNNIYEEKKDGYTNKLGIPHATIPETMTKIARFYMRVENEEGFVDLMKEKL